MDNYAVIGASNEGENLEGAVYVFERQEEWTQIQKIRPPNQVEHAYPFGRVLLANDSLLFVNSSGSDSIDIFLWEDEEYVHIQTITPDVIMEQGAFGSAISIDDSVLICGARGEDHEYEWNTGAIYLFRLEEDGLWYQQQRITAYNAENLDAFGYSCLLYTSPSPRD